MDHDDRILQRLSREVGKRAVRRLRKSIRSLRRKARKLKHETIRIVLSKLSQDPNGRLRLKLQRRFDRHERRKRQPHENSASVSEPESDTQATPQSASTHPLNPQVAATAKATNFSDAKRKREADSSDEDSMTDDEPVAAIRAELLQKRRFRLRADCGPPQVVGETRSKMIHSQEKTAIPKVKPPVEKPLPVTDPAPQSASQPPSVVLPAVAPQLTSASAEKPGSTQKTVSHLVLPVLCPSPAIAPSVKPKHHYQHRPPSLDFTAKTASKRQTTLQFDLETPPQPPPPLPLPAACKDNAASAAATEAKNGSLSKWPTAADEGSAMAAYERVKDVRKLQRNLIDGAKDAVKPQGIDFAVWNKCFHMYPGFVDAATTAFMTALKDLKTSAGADLGTRWLFHVSCGIKSVPKNDPPLAFTALAKGLTAYFDAASSSCAALTPGVNTASVTIKPGWITAMQDAMKQTLTKAIVRTDPTEWLNMLLDLLGPFLQDTRVPMMVRKTVTKYCSQFCLLSNRLDFIAPALVKNSDLHKQLQSIEHLLLSAVGGKGASPDILSLNDSISHAFQFVHGQLRIVHTSPSSTPVVVE